MGTVAVAASLFDSSAAAKIAPSTRTNIVYVHSHDSGRYLSPYGHGVPTPHLMSLARSGVVFRQMHCASPSCSSSRAAMLTGQSTHSSGMLGLAHRGWRLTHPERHIIHTLAKHGYRTILAGLQHIARDERTIGYQEILPHKSNHAKDVAPGATAFLRSAAAKEKPFFLDVGFFETHRPYPIPSDDPNFVQPPFPIPDNAQTRYDMASYYASARALDGGVGAVLDALEAAGLAETTLVISTTDHGIAFPTMKAGLRDTGTGVSMILRGPGAFATPGVCDALLSQVDLFPSLCDYLGIEKPEWLEGKSFMPVVEGQQPGINDAIFAELNFHSAYEPKRSVRTQRYKYIKRFDDRATPVLVNCDDGPSKSFWVKNDWKDQPLLADADGEELFDLIFDPAERTNLAAEQNMHSILLDMRHRLSEWMHRTDDPLLKGPIPLPAGVRTDDPNAITVAPRAKKKNE
jgi:arylsulfatase A-like enzyme